MQYNVQFLDDLRHAHVLVHVIDVSGRTNEKGENIVGYDPSRVCFQYSLQLENTFHSQDIDWLYDEIHAWIFNNIYKKWGGIIRKYAAYSASDKPRTLAEMLQVIILLSPPNSQLQLSGYGTTPSQSEALVRQLGLKEPVDLSSWEAVCLPIHIYRTVK